MSLQRSPECKTDVSGPQGQSKAFPPGVWWQAGVCPAPGQWPGKGTEVTVAATERMLNK